MTPSPPLTTLPALPGQLAATGWAVLGGGDLARLCGVEPEALLAWRPVWHALPPDPHLRDGGRYRQRRHGCFVACGGEVQAVPHRAHWQPVEYNALHGGLERWFEPLPPALAADPSWTRLLAGLTPVANALRGSQPWYIEAHAFRIHTEGDGAIGRPTPEGAHRDGVDLVLVAIIDRHNVKGGETRVFDAHGSNGVRFTLSEPWSALLLDDERVIHETTPIQPLEPGLPAWRDTLVLTFRSGGFQGPDSAAG